MTLKEGTGITNLINQLLVPIAVFIVGTLARFFQKKVGGMSFVFLPVGALFSLM